MFLSSLQTCGLGKAGPEKWKAQRFRESSPEGIRVWRREIAGLTLNAARGDCASRTSLPTGFPEKEERKEEREERRKEEGG